MAKGKDKGPANYSIHPGVSISKEPHIMYKLINILYKMSKDPKTKTTTKKEITNTKHPNQLNTETKKDS